MNHFDVFVLSKSLIAYISSISFIFSYDYSFDNSPFSVCFFFHVTLCI